MGRIRDRIIKLLGGYTKKEYTRAERKYTALLESKTTDTTVQVANERMYILITDLERFASSLYGEQSNIWAKKIYNVIHNNRLRLLVRYVNPGANILYRLDTTMDKDKEFEKIMKDEGIQLEEENGSI